MVQPKRPGVVTLVGIVVFINAALAAITAVAVFLNRDNGEWQALYKATDGELLTLAIIEGLVAILLFAVGSGVLSGAKWARLAVAIVVGIRVAVLTWYMLTHLGAGAFTWSTVISMAIGLFVLWALYGKDESVAYYDGYA
jgi:O-antigen/teichoic acid export membrane protein